jgi:hypothetical protein
LKRLSSGIRGLDELMGGGFVEGSNIMLVSDPHEAPELFLQHFIHEGLKNGECAVYCCFSVDADTLCESMSYYNMNPRKFLENEQLTIVDLHSGVRGEKSSSLPNVAVIKPQPVTDISIFMKKLFETKPITRGVCDSTVEVLRLGIKEPDAMREWAQAMCGYPTDLATRTGMHILPSQYEDDLVSRLNMQASVVLRLSVEDGKTYLQALKMRMGRFTPNKVELLIDEQGIKIK